MKKRDLLVLLLTVLACGELRAQYSAANAVPVTLGEPVIALAGPWKFQIGDNPQWSNPDFNDSGWQQYELVSGSSTLSPEEVLQSAELPGWQQHGHPGYTGYAWYRIRLRLPENVHSLALLMPRHVDDAYEVYVNGSKIGSFGNLNGWHTIYAGQPELFSIPDATLDGGQPVTLALRFWNLRVEASPTEHNLDGGLRGLPVIGPSALLEVFEQSVREQPEQTPVRAPAWMPIAALYGAVGVISIFLFLFSHGQQEFRWAGISLTGFGTMVAFGVISQMQQTMISYQLSVMAQAAAYQAAVFALPLATMYLLSVPRPLWRRASYVVSAFNLAFVLGNAGFALGLLPPTAVMGRLNGVARGLAISLLACLLLAIAVDGVRSVGRKAWLPMTPGLLFALYLSIFLLWSFGVASDTIFKFLGLPACACVPLSVLIIFLMRFTAQQRENVRLADDMRQAQEVQHLLIPSKLPILPGWLIESEYRPAREVGGDFFQIIPNEDDGSLLIVVGDVTGKGLQAGMLVAMLVGTIRTESAHTSNPARILSALNACLHGREQAQATCLALRIGADGAAALANAGHLPPYLNGEPLAMEGALPLGMIEDAEPSVMHFQLNRSDRLMLMSDGIAEATDANGKLFGFDRIRELLRTDRSAVEVAEAAQRWGQEDDITVLTVARLVTA